MDEATKKELELFAQWIVKELGEEKCLTPAEIVENYLIQSSGSTPNNNIVDDSARSEFP